MTIFGSFHSPGGISEFDVVFANTPTRNVNMRWRGVASPESVRVLIPPLSSPGYSCALVSDILLQGHLYITENYFAFHSNVFGYVTKVKNIDFWRVPKRSLSLSSKDNAMFNKTPQSSSAPDTDQVRCEGVEGEDRQDHPERRRTGDCH